jgi:hypothetical protein
MLGACSPGLVTHLALSIFFEELIQGRSDREGLRGDDSRAAVSFRASARVSLARRPARCRCP